MVCLFCFQGYKVAIDFFYATSSVQIFVLVVPASAWLPHVKNVPNRGFKFGNLNQQAGKDAGGLGRNLYQRGNRSAAAALQDWTHCSFQDDKKAVPILIREQYGEVAEMVSDPVLMALFNTLRQHGKAVAILPASANTWAICSSC